MVLLIFIVISDGVRCVEMHSSSFVFREFNQRLSEFWVLLLSVCKLKMSFKTKFYETLRFSLLFPQI